ncbi:MAG: hypothetical protein R2911_01740 [Caldilineaceae bacterium]
MGARTTNPIKNGDDITFTVTVFNQGTLIADNIVLVDYLPAGFTLSANEPNWTGSGSTVTRPHWPVGARQ